MKRVVQIFIEGQRVETFKDEEVKISSTIQAISDLSKVFTDFSQSFTIPASPLNNEIFQHFYENDVDFQNGVYINHAIRRDAIIEIDSTEFRRGKIQLEKANLKDGQPYSYQITFYGLLTSLKEIFGDNKLEDLDYTGFTHDVTYTEIKDRIEDGATDYDIRYPLISNQRYWQLDTSQDPVTPTQSENINTALGSIDVFTLCPAFKLSKLVEVIENTFNITFEGNFLLDDKYLKAFQYMKRSITPAYLSPPEDIDFTELQEFDISTGINTTLATEPTIYTLTIGTNLASIVFDLDVNSIQLGYIQYLSLGFTYDIGYHVINASVFVTPSSNIYYIDVYKNGTLSTSISGSGGSNLNLVNVQNGNNPSLNDTYSFKFRSTQGTTPISIQFEYYFTSFGTIYTDKKYILPVASLTTTNSLDLSQFAPDMKVVDWFADILKVFNLTCYGIDETTYRIETIEQWYNQGDIYDITEFTELTSIDISRIKLFKRIEFSYAKSENILNKQFAQLFNRNFGDLVNDYDFDGSEYKINVKFENILQNKFTDTNVQVGYCIKENLSAYVPKPIILYMYDEQSLPVPSSTPPIDNKSVWINDGIIPLVTSDYLTSYMPFGQDAKILATDYSLNWGAENSSLLDNLNPNGLYSTYYKGYIENLYNPKNRITKLKARLPLSTLTNLDLNDRVVIRDKRYIIDTMKTNLNTGVVDFTLYNDFRSMLADGGQIEEIDLGVDAQCIDVWIELPKTKYPQAGKVVQLVTSVAGVTISPSVISESQLVTICVPANPNGTSYLIEEELSGGVAEVYITTEGNDYFIQDQTGITQNIVITIQSTIYSTPVTIVTNYIYLNQLGEAP